VKEKLQVAVRELVEFVLATGDLNMTYTGASRTTEAIRAHQRVQRQRPSGYEAEVPISHIIETREFFLEITGRIDGVYLPLDSTSEEPVVIDEIKTTAAELKDIQQAENPIHWGQAKTYAYMYATEKDLSFLNVQLTYYQLDTKKQAEDRRPFSLEELTGFFENLVARYLKWASVQASWRQTRDAGIGRLQFPFSEYRSGQRELAVQIYKTIQQNLQLIVQAPTGIGKTMAAIFPAIMVLGKGMLDKLFYLTARTTARTAAEDALACLGKNGLRIKTLTLTAKDKICFNPDCACTAEECKFAQGYFDRIHEAREDLFNQEDMMTRDIIIKAAQKYCICPFEYSLDMARWVDVIVCDYNYAFDPRVYLRRFFSEKTGNYTFLVDEAHNLVDRSREMFSAEIRKQPFLDLRRAVKGSLPRIYKIMGRINNELVKVRKECEGSGGNMATSEAPDYLASHLVAFQSLVEKFLALNQKTEFREALLDLFFEVGAFLKILDTYDAGYMTCMETDSRELRIKLYCINPAGRMKEALGRCQSAIFFSATLTPATYFKEVFGCDSSANYYSLPSPFPKEHLGVLLINTISTRFKNREKSLFRLVQLLKLAVSHTIGNYLVFFPSYQYMNMAYDEISNLNLNVEMILQTPGMSEDSRNAYLEMFNHDNPKTLVGFAVMGGIFGEGIDLKGNRLSGAVIVGVGLPGISVENELIREYFDREKNAGFDYAYLYPGINRVLQAAGRVIRSETDRGIVLLIDERYATARYRELLPPHWMPVRVRSEEKLQHYLKEFWQ
jgi:DNA excision repair protein ERCC-2